MKNILVDYIPFEVSSDDQIWKSIYEKLSKVAESIAKQTKAWPVEIIVKLY